MANFTSSNTSSQKVHWTFFLRSTRPTSSSGGNVNITDDDGDTPLYTVESIDTARYLVDHGAAVDHRNNEGVSVRSIPSETITSCSCQTQPIEHLSEDFMPVAEYLQSVSNQANPASAGGTAGVQPSQHSQNAASEHLTSALMESARSILERAEAEGTDPDQELHQAVTRAVLTGVVTGYEMSTEDSTSSERNQGPNGAAEETPSKRPRTEGDP